LEFIFWNLFFGIYYLEFEIYFLEFSSWNLEFALWNLAPRASFPGFRGYPQIIDYAGRTHNYRHIMLSDHYPSLSTIAAKFMCIKQLAQKKYFSNEMAGYLFTKSLEMLWASR